MISSVRRIPKIVVGLMTLVVIVVTLVLAAAGSVEAKFQPNIMFQGSQETETVEVEVSTPIPTWTPIPPPTSAMTQTSTVTSTATVTLTAILTPTVTNTPTMTPFPTSTLTPNSTATPDLPSGFVNADNVFFNRVPNDSRDRNERIGQLKMNQKIWIHGKTAACTWFEVEPKDDEHAGIRGWVAAGFITVEDSISCDAIPLGEGQISPLEPQVEPSPVPPTLEPSPEPTPVVVEPIPPAEKPIPADEQGSNNTLGLILAGLGVLVLGVLAWLGIRRGWFSFLSGARSSVSPVAGPVGSQPPKPGIAYLEGRLATGEAVFFPLKKAVTTIGRMEDNVVVLDARFANVDSISRYHAKIERDGDQYILTDLQSENGVFVGQRRSSTNMLVDGAMVRFGQIDMLFRTNAE